VQQCPTILDCLWFSDEANFHLDWFVNRHNTRFWASKNAHRIVEISLHPEMCTITDQRYLQ